MHIEQILEALKNPSNDNERLDILRYILENDVDVNIKLESVEYFNELHQSFNNFIRENDIDESCIVGPNDTAAMVRKKCKKAFKHSGKYHPIYRTYVHAAAGGTGDIGGMMESQFGGHNYHPSGDYSVSYFAGPFRKRTPPEEKKTFTHRLLDPDSGYFPDEETEETLEEKKKTSTERVRRYYKRNPEKVKAYLRKTVKDRVARNRDRKKAVEKYGKKKMKNHDVHHPNGAQNGNWRLAKKDHGRDKKNESTLPSTGKMTCRFCGWSWSLKDGGEHPYTCHKCWNDNTQLFLTEDRVQENITKFVEYATEQLKLNKTPTVKIVDKIGGSYSSLGSYSPDDNEICVVVNGRLLADILRTIAHELIHAKQMQMGLIKNPVIDGKTGSRIENSANAMAGIMMRNYGQLNTEIFLTEGLIMEGGAAGHLAHPYENENLTFDDMREMARRGLTGELGGEAPVTEKLDGQNLAVSYKDGRVIFSRNPGQVRNRGKTALVGAEGVAEFFRDHPAEHIRDGFTAAAQDLESAIMALPEEERQRIFADGAKFGNLEVMSSSAENAIPYGKNVLIFHGTIEYDENGNEIGRSVEDGKQLADMITRAGAEEQKTYGISGPRSMAFSEAEREKNEERLAEHLATFDRLQAEFNLPNDATLEDYQLAWWDRQIDTLDFDVPDEIREGLVRRWAMGDKKALKMTDIKDKELRAKITEFEDGGKVSGPLGQARKAANAPFRRAFLRIGVDTMRRVTNILAANNPAAAEKMKRALVDAIREIRESGDEAKLAILQRNLEDLAEAGIDPERGIGLDDIVPSEGIVFVYNGETYKFTGVFAPLNQILGTIKFDRGGAGKKGEPLPTETTDTETAGGAAEEEPSTEQPVPTDSAPTDAPEESSPRRTVAIFTGRFQPFHAGHYSIYQGLVEQFGKENVYIASSGKTDAIRSPFEFDEKRQIMTRMFDIPEEMIVQVQNPYAPKEITSQLPEDTVYVTAVSEKDAERLGSGAYFRNLEDVPEEERVGYTEGGYYIVAPEMQLAIDGKNISGTQLRHIFGSPEFTDRVKEEIFTKIYGQFDREIFDRIVKVTTKSEEAKAITAAHTSVSDKPARSKAQKEKAAAEADKIRNSGVLQQKILNQDTGNEIYVATALGSDYEGTQVQQMAHQMIRSVVQQNESILTENILMEKRKSEKIKQYLYTRDYTEEELDSEVEEYFENERTKKLFPKLASDKTELKDMIEDADEIVLDKKFLKMLANSEVPEVLSSDNPAEILKKIEDEYDRDVKGLLKAIKNEEELPLPIVIQHPKGVYLMAGNSRLSVLASINHTMPVKLLKYTPDVDTDLDDDSGKVKMTDKEVRKARRKEFQDVLDTRIINPETGNKIKVNTAMDYNKNHPAHKVAMELIRSRMAGLSPTAGIPKQRKS